MSSSGGIGGGGRINPTPTTQPGIGGPQGEGGEAQALPAEAMTIGNAEFAADGSVKIAGEPVDISTAQGAAALKQAVNAEEFETVKGLLQLKQVDGPDGPILVPDDKYTAVDTSALHATLGPGAVDAGADELDELIGTVFTDNGVPNPYNANTIKGTEATIRENGVLQTGTQKLESYIQNPTQEHLDGFLDYMKNIESQGGNIMEVLFLCFKESIKETNEDKKYFLKKLQDFNVMGERLSEYLGELADVSRELNEASAGEKYPEMIMVTATVRTFDTSTLNKTGEMVQTSEETCKLGAQSLNSEIKKVEATQETVRNKRQMASTAFQSFDQKSNQLYNLLSSVMKAMNEMRMGTTRNML